MLAGIGAAAVSIPIIIHLMSRFRRTPEPWGAMRFLMEAYRKQRKRMQVEKLLLLLVRCLVVLLAGLALSGPMLGGCSSGGMSLSGDSGRVVYLVIDDALSSQTREAAGETRLAGLKREALSVIDEMDVNDRAVIVRMARPVTLALDEPTSDTEQLRETVESIESRSSRGDLIGALGQVDASMRSLGLSDGSAVVVLLSDFPRSADYFETNLPPELEDLGRRASIVTALPPTGTANLQVSSLVPRRWVVVAEADGSTVVGGRVELTRFGGISEVSRAVLEVKVSTLDGEVLAESTRPVTWPVGERTRGANFDLPVQVSADDVAGVGRELVVSAQLMPGVEAAGLDVLSADDLARSVVRLRDHLRVAVVDAGEDVNPNAGEFEPAQWVRAALSPGGVSSAGSFEVTSVLPTSLSRDALLAQDAAMVLRPEQLTLRGWERLHDFAKQGGLVWVFPPAIVDWEADWAMTMQRQFDLPWDFGEGLMVTYQPADGSTQQSARVDETTAPPKALEFLAADWREKLGWWTLRSWLPLSTPDEDRWVVLKTDDPAVPERDKPVILAERSIGDGSLVFSAVPLDTRFTNLPIRALFVPLMHDTLRGVLGASSGRPVFVAGDTPRLDRSWRGVGELTRIGSVSGQGVDEQTDEPSLLITSDGDTVGLRSAVQTTGLYRGTSSGASRLLVVNPDASAGDTFGGQQSIELLLDRMGGWAYLDASRDAGGVLGQAMPRQDWTMALLWVLLGLVLLETGLARWFSHATDRDGPTVVGRVLGAIRGETVNTSASVTTRGGGVS